VVRVKVGPITAQYKGVARFVEKDDVGHRAVVRAEGRETRGQGNANATVTAELQPDGEGTKVSVDTELMVTGRVAQFGRGVLAEVSAKLLDQFVVCLEHKLQGDGDGDGGAGGDGAGAATAAGTAAADGSGTAAARGRTGETPPATPEPGAPVDLLGAAGAPVAKRVLPVALAMAVVWWLWRRVRRRRSHPRGRRGGRR
jgi:carbon monoxide dehydrogenase subunit G